MGWATKLGAPRLQTKDAMVERAAAIQLGQYGLPYLNSWDVQRAIGDGYDRVMWVFRCIDAIASNAAQLPVILRKGDPDKGDVVTDHPALDMMNNKANGFETADAFWYRLFSQYMLSKKGVFVEIRYNRGGDPAEMYLLPPQWTDPIPDPDNFVSAYRVSVPGGKAWVDVPAVDPGTGMPAVVWVRKPHPIDPYSGVTPLESVGLSIDIDFYARLYNRAFLQNDGRPGGIVAVKGQLNDNDAEELRRRFSAGPNKAGSTAVIEADDLSWVDVATSPRDAQYVESRSITKEEILLAFGVPESIMGNASGRTYDNADAEKLVFWQETMQFHLRLVAGYFDFFTDPDFKTAFDTTSIAVLRRDREQEEDHDKGLVVSGLVTIDEFRQKHGRDPFGTPASRALWLPSSLVPQPAEGDEQAFAPMSPPEPGRAARGLPPEPQAVGDIGEAAPKPIPAAPAPPPPAALPAAKPDGAAKSVLRPKGVGSLTPQMRNGIVDEAEKQRLYFEQKAKDTASALFKRQKKVVLAKVKGTKARKGTRHWVNPDGRAPIVTKQLSVDDVFDTKRWDDEWTDEFSDLGSEILGTVSDNVADEFGAADDYDATDEESAAAIALLARAHGKVAAQANVTTKQAVADMLQANEEDDQDIEDIEDGLGDYFDQSADVDNGRSSDIGTWFAVGAIGMGAMHAAQSLYGDDGSDPDTSGNVITKAWVSQQDGLVRATHVEADGSYGDADSSIPLDQAFNVGGSDLMYPGDPDGDPGQTINCRCVLVFYRDGEQTDDSSDDSGDEKSLQAKYSDDQPRDDHGRFGSGSGSSSSGSSGSEPAAHKLPADFKPVSKGIFEMAKEGGFTYNPKTGESPSTGIAVARNGTSGIIDEKKFFESEATAVNYTTDYVLKNAAALKDPTAHVGGWWDTEHHEFTLDVTDVLSNEADAIKLGKERDQQAVFNLATFDTIDTGGTGGRDDESQHIKTAGNPDRNTGSRDDRGRSAGNSGEAGGSASKGSVQELTDEELVAEFVTVAFKYSPDQERDDHGRFGSGGGGSSAPDGHRATADEVRKTILYRDIHVASNGSVSPTKTGELKAGLAKELAPGLAQKHMSQLADIGRADLTHDAVYRMDPSTGYYRYVWNQETGGTDPRIRGGYLGGQPDDKRGDDPAVAANIAEKATSQLMSAWASSSNDSNIQSLNMQRAAAEEFGLKDALPQKNTLFYEDTQKSIQNDDYAKNGSLYRDFMRAQYDNTQKQFADAGIVQLPVYRGYKFDTQSLDPSMAKPGWTSESGDFSLPQRPLSSWSLSEDVAKEFATGNEKAVVSATIPVSQVLSTPRSGLGCFAEQEVVTLGNVTARIV